MSVASDISPTRLEPTPVDSPQSASALGIAVDLLSDMAVLAFATWTLLAYLAMLAGLPVWTITAAWLVSLPVVAIARWRMFTAARRQAATEGVPAWDDEPDIPPSRRSEPPRIGSWPVVVGALTIAVVAAVIGGEYQAHWFDLAWAAGLVTLLLAFWAQFRATSPVDPQRPTVTRRLRSHAWLSDAIALVVALGSGGLAVFTRRIDADDVFYINRASSVADLGRIPTRDALLSHGHFAPVAGTGSPVDALAPLEGSLARLVGVHAASVAYLVEPPIAVALGVWALWRLVRRWAPRRALLCFLLAVLYLYEAGSGHLSFGNFFLTRIQQGKVVFVTWMIPTLFVYLTDWARAGRRTTGLLITAACVGALGLTSSATFDVPLIVVAALLPLVVARRWSGLVLPAAAAAFPLVVGTICSRLAPPSQAQIRNFQVPSVSYGAILGIGLIAVIGAIALWLGPWLVRDRSSQLIVMGTMVVAVVALAPEVLFEVHNAINLGGALQRVLWVVPLPALVGLLAAYPPMSLVRARGETPTTPHRSVGWGALPITALLVVLLLVDGSPILSYGTMRVLGHPTWRVPPLAAARAGAVTKHVDSGVVLAPLQTMSVIAIESGKITTVDPRTFYSRQIPQPASLLADRLRLDRMIVHGMEGLSRPTLTTALNRLHVTTACASVQFVGVEAYLRQRGFRPGFSAPAGLVCFERRAPGVD